MRLLLISDEEDRYLWDFYRPGCLDGFDIILSAGDLKAEYLSFLVTLSNLPLLYVHGNHDVRYDQAPPEGCECIDDRLVTVKGLRILGLGDDTDLAHRGFEAFLPLLDRWHPAVMVHGHVHRSYRPSVPRVLQYGETRIVNASGKYYLDL